MITIKSDYLNYIQGSLSFDNNPYKINSITTHSVLTKGNQFLRYTETKIWRFGQCYLRIVEKISFPLLLRPGAAWKKETDVRARNSAVVCLRQPHVKSLSKANEETQAVLMQQTTGSWSTNKSLYTDLEVQISLIIVVQYWVCLLR